MEIHRRWSIKIKFLALFLVLGFATKPAVAQFGSRLVKGVGHVFDKGSREHIFSVFLLAALGSSDSASRNLEHFAETGDWSSWDAYKGAIESEIFSTELNAKLLGYGVVDLVVEGGALGLRRLSPKTIGPIVSSFMGRQFLGIMGFWGWDVMREVHRCARAQLISDLDSESLNRKKIVLGRVDDLWDMFTREPEIAKLYFESTMSCLAEQDTYEIAKSRFLDFESLSFWVVLSASIEGGAWIGKGVEDVIQAQRKLLLTPEKAALWGRRLRRISCPLATLLLVGPLYRMHEDTVVRDVVNVLNFEFEEIRKDHAEKNLFGFLDLFKKEKFLKIQNELAANGKVKKAEKFWAFEELSEFNQTRGYALGHHLSQAAVSAKTLTPFFEEYFAQDPAVRIELTLASGGSRGFKDGSLEILGRKTAQQIFRGRLRTRFAEYQELQKEKIRLENSDDLYSISRFVPGTNRRIDILDTLSSLERDFLIDFPFLSLGRGSFDVMERVTLDNFAEKRRRIDRALLILRRNDTDENQQIEIQSQDFQILGEEYAQALYQFRNKRNEIFKIYLEVESQLKEILKAEGLDWFEVEEDRKLVLGEIKRSLEETQKVLAGLKTLLNIEDHTEMMGENLIWIEILGQLDNPENRVLKKAQSFFTKDPKYLRIIGDNPDLLLRSYIEAEFIVQNPLQTHGPGVEVSPEWTKSLRQFVAEQFDARRRWVRE
jgi:hypothetical protein